MTWLLLALTLAAAPVQAAITTALFRDPLAAPVLPVALIAAWAVMRDVRETWPALILPAVVLGVASEERVGWFLLAMLPAPAIAVVATRAIRPRVTGVWRRLLIAAGVAAGAAVLYATLLSVGGGVTDQLGGSASAIVGSAMLSAALAVVAAVAFWPLRPRERGLFE